MLETRNPPEEWLFCWELPAHGLGIHWKNGYSAGNYLLMEVESNRGIGFHRLIDEESKEMGFCRELLAYEHLFRLARSKCAKNPPNSNNFRISNFKSSILRLPI
jgi:hypothetical protein